ncbi:uncharacterized protein STEHIDRAFT_76611 [Stereum hirsutum FP-91666 SS1]|uniref:uncharacterized protein n=1 Tax=Stereum hirsutum (strain FP-91666) TaxID=721885 RepID=UPI0004409D94|nr:uncharacterized protein STEHIDRAFT_76611 [Stereum hirsutum FP-91666 SS1]EIM87953.1 hypothetical protein STEHIDRAFT_76611 [Stereum hirsutum FP-91666 SS1]
MLSIIHFSFLVALISQLLMVQAQFPFFDQMFGHGGRQQQQQPAGGHSQWMAHSEAVPCSSYLCPDTLACVSRPEDCPCPNVQDVKCVITDSEQDESGTVVCVRGGIDCKVVEGLANKFTK